MADHTKIEWADATFNPWIGCTKVSPACDHCYAEVSTPSRTRGIEWGAGKPRQSTSATNWKQPLLWNHTSFYECGDCSWRGETESNCPKCAGEVKAARRRVFCASLADVFDNEVPEQWRVELIGLIRKTPNIDWLLLTKRIGNALNMLEQAVHNLSSALLGWDNGREFPNVWIGATICNQAEADRDIPKLLCLPAAVRFLSIEPMLGPISLDAWPIYGPDREQLLNWIIAGGESGAHARPPHPDWFRSLRDQCEAAGVPFLFKQWGEWLPTDAVDQEIYSGCHKHLGGPWHAYKVGKKAAGRLLDGVQHDGYPTP